MLRTRCANHFCPLHEGRRTMNFSSGFLHSFSFPFVCSGFHGAEIAKCRLHYLSSFLCCCFCFVSLYCCGFHGAGITKRRLHYLSPYFALFGARGDLKRLPVIAHLRTEKGREGGGHEGDHLTLKHAQRVEPIWTRKEIRP